MLPGAEIWPAKDVEAAIAFERGVSRSASRLEALLDAPRRAREPAARAGFDDGVDRLTDGVFALARGAELAFATDRVDLGLTLCREITDAWPETPMHFAMWATAGALVGSTWIRGFRRDGVAYGHAASPDWPLRRRGLERVWPWPQTSVDGAELGRRLLPAAACAASIDEIFGALEARDGQGGLSEGARVAIRTSLEAEAVLNVTPGLSKAGAPTPPMGMIGLEAAYGARLRFLRASPRWSALDMDGSIIDWSLLALWVAAVQNSGPAPESLPALTDDGRFLRTLAQKIVALRRGS